MTPFGRAEETRRELAPILETARMSIPLQGTSIVQAQANEVDVRP